MRRSTGNEGESRLHGGRVRARIFEGGQDDRNPDGPSRFRAGAAAGRRAGGHRDARGRSAHGDRPDKAGYVDAGSIVSFVAGVPLQHKHDVLNSTLLAQLAANAKYDREKQVVEWYKFYREVLENVGWVLGGFSFNEVKGSGSEFTADKVIIKVLEAIATGNDLAVVAAAIAALQSLGDDDPAVKVFETSSHTANQGNFQIAAAAESDGVVVMKLGAFAFTTTQTVTRVLWFRFESGATSFYKGDLVINLDDQIYAQVRQAVVEKLGDKAITFVKNLKIAV